MLDVNPDYADTPGMGKRIYVAPAMRTDADCETQGGHVHSTLRVLTGADLAAIERGALDVKAIARAVLLERGCGIDGKWVGFAAAEQLWKEAR